MRRTPALLGLLLAAVSACSGAAETVSTENVVPTSVLVVPGDFLGAVPCSSDAGALRSYVATLTDSTDPGHPFDLPSSPPTPCSQLVSFRDVQIGHQYTAAIDGYDRPASALASFGGPFGSRKVVDAATGEAVLPRWKTSCATAVTPEVNTAVSVTAASTPATGAATEPACSPLVDNGPVPPPAVEVDPMVTLGVLACAATPGGTIASFDIMPAQPGFPNITGQACGSEPVVFALGVQPGATYSFTVSAYEADGPAKYRATCVATAREGLTVHAACDPLGPIQ